jgi:hypothetical protein
MGRYDCVNHGSSRQRATSGRATGGWYRGGRRRGGDDRRFVVSHRRRDRDVCVVVRAAPSAGTEVILRRAIEWFGCPCLVYGLVVACGSSGGIDLPKQAALAGNGGSGIGLGGFTSSSGGKAGRGGAGGAGASISGSGGTAGVAPGPCDSGTTESCRAETCNGVKRCVGGAWEACECLPVPTGGAAGVGGSPDATDGGEAGGGGEAGAAICAPLSSDEACGSKNCGAADDGCGAELLCGTCQGGHECSADQLCEDCHCPAGWCGVLTMCSRFVWCGGCNHPEACYGQSDGMKACEQSRLCSKPASSCCSENTKVCFRAYYGSACDPGERLSPRDGTPCGECIHSDGLTHYCFAGEL